MAEIPWIEKYRPETLRDVIGNSEAVTRLAAIAKSGNMPNLILTGPPGIGKTSSVLCLAREMLGESNYKDAVLELNASDSRGIDVVRSKIKLFAQKKVSLQPGQHKIIILDEADAMTGSAQQALRRTMEIYSSSTRFALACNNSTKIIEPIQSRCAVLRFSKLTDVEVLCRVKHVIDAETIAYDQSGLDAVLFISEGDMRIALNSLQSTVSGFGFVNSTNVFKICDQPQPYKVKLILESAVQGKVSQGSDLLIALWNEGYSAADIIQTMFKVAKSLELSEAAKLSVIREIGFSHVRISEGLYTLLQLLGCLARVSIIAHQK